MNEISELVSVIDALLAPNGCPWDREQTLQSMRSSLLEETCEVIDAIDICDSGHIQEELGDLMFNVLFMCKLAEKEVHCPFHSIFKGIVEKLIRRHPHIFGDAVVTTSEEVLDQWQQIKKTEPGKDIRKTIFEGIPKNLPALARAQKMLRKIKKNGRSVPTIDLEHSQLHDEESVGKILLGIVHHASQNGVDAEQSLRAALTDLEQNYRD